jgi:hypothetical protein
MQLPDIIKENGENYKIDEAVLEGYLSHDGSGGGIQNGYE